MKTGILLTCVISGFLAVALNTGRADEINPSQPADFQRLSHEAVDKKLPILVLFSSSDCDYCTVVIEEFINPILISGDYTDKVIIRVVDIDDGENVRDFTGRLVDSDTFATRYGIELTPTIVFLDARGHEISQRIMGLGTIDLYGGYLDAAIDDSLAIMQDS
ncbi:thioredoxin family protein [Sulfuriflexus mobilis]|uniref:thioredoxin family protein n=1 Tax=Sulfuriflexus mobilis TaxID=1811807 RepID=UPI000F83F598|nr:thioredoxin fold domain-containing protein [Sulfuriflexus mobilis]